MKNKSRVSDIEQNEAIVSNYHIVPDDSTNLLEFLLPIEKQLQNSIPVNMAEREKISCI